MTYDSFAISSVLVYNNVILQALQATIIGINVETKMSKKGCQDVNAKIHRVVSPHHIPRDVAGTRAYLQPQPTPGTYRYGRILK